MGILTGGLILKERESDDCKIYFSTIGEGHVDTLEGTWRTTCPEGCMTEEGNPSSLRPILHIPFDPDLFHELNVERYELGKTGKILYNHPQGTHDDRFWALALAVYASEQAPPPPSRPIAKVI